MAPEPFAASGGTSSKSVRRSFGSYRGHVVLNDGRVVPMRALEGGVRGTTVPQPSSESLRHQLEALAAAIDVPLSFGRAGDGIT